MARDFEVEPRFYLSRLIRKGKGEAEGKGRRDDALCIKDESWLLK